MKRRTFEVGVLMLAVSALVPIAGAADLGLITGGTYLTARLLLKVSEVAPKEMVPIDTEEALVALKAGTIDAMFYVAGYPVKLFTEQVTARDDLALVPITNKSITEFYPRSEIPVMEAIKEMLSE